MFLLRFIRKKARQELADNLKFQIYPESWIPLNFSMDNMGFI